MGFLPKDLERSVSRIVRRVIREGEATSRLSRGILELVKDETKDGSVNPDTLVQIVTERVCEFCRSEFAKGKLQSGQLVQTIRWYCTEA